MSTTQNTFQRCLDEYGGGSGGGGLTYFVSRVLTGSSIDISLTTLPDPFPRGIYLYINDFVSTNGLCDSIGINIDNQEENLLCVIPTTAGAPSDVNATILHVAVDGYLITGQSANVTKTVFDVDIDPRPTNIQIVPGLGNFSSGTVHIFYA